MPRPITEESTMTAKRSFIIRDRFGRRVATIRATSHASALTAFLQKAGELQSERGLYAEAVD